MYLAPRFPHSHFSYSPVSPLFPCFSVSLLVCSLFFTFLCPFVLLSSYVSRHPCSERSSLSRFLFPTSHFPLSRFLDISFLFFLNFFPRHYSSLQSSNFDSTLQKRWETNANQQTLLTGHSFKIFLLWGGRLGALFYPQIFARVACSVIFHLDLFVCLNTILAIPS